MIKSVQQMIKVYRCLCIARENTSVFGWTNFQVSRAHELCILCMCDNAFDWNSAMMTKVNIGARNGGSWSLPPKSNCECTT